MSFQFLACQLTRFFLFLYKSQLCQIWNCACQSTCILFLYKFLRVKSEKLAKTLSNIHTALDPNLKEGSFTGCFGAQVSWYGPFLISGLHAIQICNFSPSINGGHFQGTECFLSTVVALKVHSNFQNVPHPHYLPGSSSSGTYKYLLGDSQCALLDVVVEGNEAIMALPPTFHWGKPFNLRKEWWWPCSHSNPNPNSENHESV